MFVHQASATQIIDHSTHSKTSRSFTDDIFESVFGSSYCPAPPNSPSLHLLLSSLISHGPASTPTGFWERLSLASMAQVTGAILMFNAVAAFFFGRPANSTASQSRWLVAGVSAERLRSSTPWTNTL